MLVMAGVLLTSASSQTTAQEQAAKLRAQLTEVQTRQEEQQARLRYLEEDLKPENIEHSLAGVGSTHPEELREQRRRQLEREKTAVQTQLDQLAVSRTRLETAVAEADARAYQESARGPHNAQLSTVESPTSAAAPPPQAAGKTRRHRRVRRATRHTSAAPVVKG